MPEQTYDYDTAIPDGDYLLVPASTWDAIMEGDFMYEDAGRNLKSDPMFRFDGLDSDYDDDEDSEHYGVKTNRYTVVRIANAWERHEARLAEQES